MQKRLTEASVSKIKPDPNKRLEIHDVAVPGLRLRIAPNGRRSWSFMFKIAGEAVDGGRGKNRRMTLGTYPLVGLKDAREKAAAAQELADHGLDPVAEKNALIRDRAARRIEELVPRYIELHAKPNTKRWADTEKLLQAEVVSRWEGLDCEALTRAQVHALLDDVIEKKGPSQAREVRKHLSTLLNWAVDRGIIPYSPMAGTQRKDLRYESRERVLSIEELHRIWDVADKVGYPFGPIVQLLILSGQRRSEIANLRRDWIKDTLIEIPASEYKTRTEHVIPLTPRMKSILDAQPIWNGGDYVFSGTGGRTPSSGFSKAKLIFDRHVEIEESWTFHDIRRSVSTHMARIGIMQEHIERILGHVIAGVAGTYNRYSYIEERRDALERWETELFHCEPA